VWSICVQQCEVEASNLYTITCVTVRCSVLQCVAVCCSVIQCVTVCCIVLQCVALWCSALQCVAVRYSVLHCVAECCIVMQCVAVCCSVIHCVTVCCSCVAGRFKPVNPHVSVFCRSLFISMDLFFLHLFWCQFISFDAYSLDQDYNTHPKTKQICAKLFWYDYRFLLIWSQVFFDKTTWLFWYEQTYKCPVLHRAFHLQMPSMHIKRDL